ncbi:MAG: hypothetical protein LWW87_00030 [Geobacteraceae bacterium]|nr:hypothetical protein [Geobacteraceae bacterium]
MPCLLLFFSTAAGAASRLTISIHASSQLLASAPAKNAVDDTLQLLQRVFPQSEVTLNRDGAVILQLPDRIPPAAAGSVPDQSYHWRSSRKGTRTVLLLHATSPEGVSAGLYGLLQEQLKIRFVHPRQTIFPRYRTWPLPAVFSFSGQPRFRHQGFHLHTLHPMELTEQLHDPLYPGGFEDVIAYLDWLARNGQNSFQFFLLREVDRTAWPAHARRIVAYAHGRGIHCGVEISLAMLQQQAFQAITLLKPLPTHRRQVEQTLDWLFQAPWDFITLESMMGEHLPLISRLLPSAQRHLEQLVERQYGRPLLYATHVIRGRKEEKVRRPLHPASGILIHTVMCYSASEDKAPVYGNRNQCFMLEAAKAEVAVRQTWYWPESSYWVGFDSSVPLLLLPYLDSRWDDIRVMEKLGLHGHLTFSTGWEWGYWLVDWSIARWSWQYRDNGRLRGTSPLSRLAELLPDRDLNRQWQRALQLQNRFLKQQELLRYLAAATPFSELPAPFDLPFQPAPEFSYRWLLHDADDTASVALLNGPVAGLRRYAEEMEVVTNSLTARISLLRRNNSISEGPLALAQELRDALQMTALRARHRSLTLQALTVKHRDALGGQQESDRLLLQAGLVRQNALQQVRQRELQYRYPVELLARQRSSLTAYPFGYLYPVAGLFFWQREEEQVRHERFDPLFMKLWDIRRTLGLGSAFTHT